MRNQSRHCRSSLLAFVRALFLFWGGVFNSVTLGFARTQMRCRSSMKLQIFAVGPKLYIVFACVLGVLVSVPIFRDGNVWIIIQGFNQEMRHVDIHCWSHYVPVQPF